MAHRIKLIFFDMEGTLFRKAVKLKENNGNIAPSAWTLIAQHLGENALQEENATHDKWSKGKYSGYVEWMEDSIRIHKKYGLTKEFFDKVMSSIEYYPGVAETFEALRKKGCKTALVSGGFKAQADRAMKDLKINHGFAACEYFWNDDGTIAHWNLLPCDYEGKLEFMKLIMKEHGLTREQCAFVGDGINDVPFANAVGLSISFNGAPELQKACTHSVVQEEGKEDFRAILKYL